MEGERQFFMTHSFIFFPFANVSITLLAFYVLLLLPFLIWSDLSLKCGYIPHQQPTNLMHIFLKSSLSIHSHTPLFSFVNETGKEEVYICDYDLPIFSIAGLPLSFARRKCLWWRCSFSDEGWRPLRMKAK